jgi:DNA-directed RNA polymerase alpha subunit
MTPYIQASPQQEITALRQQIQLRQSELKELERSLAVALAQQALGQAARPALTNHERLAIEPIEVLGLTLRTASSLRSDNILYVGDLLRHTEQTLSRRSSLGIVQVQEIIGVMAARGLRLAEPQRLV